MPLFSDPRDEMSQFVTRVSEDLKEEVHSAMLHDNMNISRRMVHAQHVEEASLGGRVEILRRQDLLMVVLQRIGLRYKTSVDLTSGFLIKFIPISLRLVCIGCLTLRLKRERVLFHQSRSELVEIVARSTMVIALRGWIIALVVAIVVTR